MISIPHSLDETTIEDGDKLIAAKEFYDWMRDVTDGLNLMRDQLDALQAKVDQEHP